jgi:hypothetical protein
VGCTAAVNSRLRAGSDQVMYVRLPLETLLAGGKVRAIGVSKFMVDH